MFELNKIYCMDCLEGMKQIPDKSIDLILTDPPYGILNGISTLGGPGTKNVKNKNYGVTLWDNKPDKKVINEFFRLSNNIICFGGEHLSDILPQSKGWIVWDKIIPDGMNFSQCELIWTSYKKPIKIIRHRWHGFLNDNKFIETEKRFHITQKPLELIYKLVKMYSDVGDLVVDPFMGSGTTAVACKQLGRDFIGFELCQEYVDIANKRLCQETLVSSGLF